MTIIQLLWSELRKTLRERPPLPPSGFPCSVFVRREGEGLEGVEPDEPARDRLGIVTQEVSFKIGNRRFLNRLDRQLTTRSCDQVGSGSGLRNLADSVTMSIASAAPCQSATCNGPPSRSLWACVVVANGELSAPWRGESPPRSPPRSVASPSMARARSRYGVRELAHALERGGLPLRSVSRRYSSPGAFTEHRLSQWRQAAALHSFAARGPRPLASEIPDFNDFGYLPPGVAFALPRRNRHSLRSGVGNFNRVPSSVERLSKPTPCRAIRRAVRPILNDFRVRPFY
jgi:hypothetical protein